VAKNPSKSARRARRVLMVAPTSFFSDYGGHIRILEETLALQALGEQVTITTYYKGSNLPGLDIRRTPRLPYRAEYEVGSSRHKLAFDLFLTVTSLREALRIRPDIVHGHMHEGALIGALVARLLRVPLVFDFQGSLSGEMVDHGFLDVNGPYYPLVNGMERRICHMPDAILTSSLQAQEILSNDFEVPESRIYPLPDCVDVSRFDPGSLDEEARESLRRELGLPQDRPVVAYLGLLTDYQGTPQIIQAAAYLKARAEAVHFLVMGYPSVRHYQELARSAGLEDMMTFTGKVMYRDAPLYLSLGDIAISPKVSASEGSGKVLNYMAMGQPVVAFDTPVHREYLDESAVYAPAGDAAALADGVARLARSPELRRSLGQALRQRAETPLQLGNSQGRRIQSLYDGLCPGKRGRRDAPGGSA
jgi:glycosyltransferase involved in cell wall biosynthesis